MVRDHACMDVTSRLGRLDARVGDGLEAVLRRHHLRRLRKLGWSEALETPGKPGWWSTRAPVRAGNSLDVLVDGASALPQIEDAIRNAQQYVHITGWHASPDFHLSRGEVATPLRDLLAEAALRVPVRLLLWAGPPVPVFRPSRPMVKHAREEFIRDSRVECALDKRERTMHCHHEKVVVVDGDLAFIGGIDLTALQGDRHDDDRHPPRDPLGWHDAAVRLRGPAVADVARHFVQRWNAVTTDRLPEPVEPKTVGNVEIQVLRTVPEKTYPFAPRGEFTILDAYVRALASAERYIYLENQFLWSPEIVDILADKLAHPPCDEFRLLLLLPARPATGADTTRGQLGRLLEADGDHGRLLAATISAHEEARSAPVYVHAKVGVIDDRWLTVGSANLNEHSLFNDTEMNVLTCDPDLARSTRLRLWSEHTEQPVEDLDGDPHTVIDEVWRPIAEEQVRRHRDGLPPTHRLRRLEHVSRRADRLQGPLRGLLVDG
jgi:phosphatidylserine/phosphatidylglycerophosphate/cardiolipin synthase-like enzyme